VKFFRRKLPKPLDPKIEPQQDIYLPYWLADAPRQFIAWLAQYSELTERQRSLLASWLMGYNTELVAWLVMYYGYEGVEAADALSKDTFARFVAAVDDEYKAHEDELFTRLEEEMGDE
jgi:hypothetical protein